MAVTITLSSTTKRFIEQLAKDYPDISIERGPREHWSPKSNTITFNPKQTPERIRFGVLHELAHALLSHTSYQSDFELLKMESEAWHLARKTRPKIGGNYQGCPHPNLPGSLPGLAAPAHPVTVG